MSFSEIPDPASEHPSSSQTRTHPKRPSISKSVNRQDEEDALRLNRRRRSSRVPFKETLDNELNPYIFIDGQDDDVKANNTDKNQQSYVRRRILVEPSFSQKERTTGAAEDNLRQIILDQGITDQSLVDEINRGSNSAYELGTYQPLRNIHDYVDFSSEALVQGYVKENATRNVLFSNTFRYMVLFVILLNTVLIGLETQPTISMRYGALFDAIENLIMAAFILEILIKWYYNFDVFWKGGWNILDFVIVCILFFGSNLKFLGTSRVLRILRVIRAFRSLRDTPLFSGLSLIFQTITRSLPDMANICLLMGVVISLLGVVGVQLFGELSPNNFGSFSDAVFSIFICQTQRGWIDIFNPFIAAGGTYYWGSFIYFVLTITLTAFVLKNMFVAVVVTNLRTEMRLSQAERDRKQAKRDNTKLSIKHGSDNEELEDGGEGIPQNKLEPLVEVARGWKPGEGQRRVLLPMFLHTINLEELQKFLFLHVALEENLQEYQKLRARLKEIYGLLRSMNHSYFHQLRKNVALGTAPKRRSKS